MFFQKVLSAILLTAFAVPLAVVARAQVPDVDKSNGAASAQLQPVLVELFTSEGCSSCPPADAFLEKMDAQPVKGEQLIVMSEHVTYWDHDGWKDPNSSAEFTERQDEYEKALGLPTPYTPQIIFDGINVWRTGDSHQAQDILERAKTIEKVPIRIVDVTIAAGNPSILRAHIEADANFNKQNAEVYAALALDHVESQVLHGENGGKRLTHVAVVRQLITVGKLQKGKAFDQTVELKLRNGDDPKNLRLIVFIQEPGLKRVLGAAMRKPLS